MWDGSVLDTGLLAIALVKCTLQLSLLQSLVRGLSLLEQRAFTQLREQLNGKDGGILLASSCVRLAHL